MKLMSIMMTAFAKATPGLGNLHFISPIILNCKSFLHGVTGCCHLMER